MKIKADNRGRVALGKLLPGQDLAHGEWTAQVTGGGITLTPEGQVPEAKYETINELELQHIGRVVSVTFQSRHDGENRRVTGILNSFTDGPEKLDQVLLSGKFLDLSNSTVLKIRALS